MWWAWAVIGYMAALLLVWALVAVGGEPRSPPRR